ncbi:hypothetical protein JCM10213_008441 [Rhodosporidiobolus nylandii]
MLLKLLLCLFAPVLALASQLSFEPESALPPAPRLEWIFTATFQVRPNVAPLRPGPMGIRLDIAILGGEVKGRHGLTGRVRPVGSDWVRVDPVSGNGLADARWSIVLPSVVHGKRMETEVFVRTLGPSLPGTLSKAHLHMRFEAPAGEFGWLNWICAIGILEILNPDNKTAQTTVINVYHLEYEHGPSHYGPEETLGMPE